LRHSSRWSPAPVDLLRYPQISASLSPPVGVRPPKNARLFTTLKGLRMPIILRGEKFQVTVHRNRKRYRRTFTDHQEAKVWEAQAVADLVAGKLPDLGETRGTSSPRTVQELAWHTYRTEWSGTPSDDKAQININQLIDALGSDTLIQDVNASLIDAAKLSWKARGNAPGTINRKLSCLSKILSKAMDMGIIDEKPKLTKEKEPPSRIRWYTDQEKVAISEALKELGYDRYVGLVEVLMGTGLRCGELFRLQPRDIQGNLIVVEINKSAWPRSVPMTKRVRTVINRELSAMARDQETLWGWTTYEKFSRVWNEARGALGWSDDPQAIPHACRHTFITNLVQRGVSMPVIQKLAGHRSITMTMKYAHLGSQDLEGAISALEG